MDAEDLRVFEAVARSGGITRASEILHTVQSNVTGRIKRLESELGARLFHRHKKGVSLTTAGEQLVPYAERVQQLLAEAKNSFVRGGAPSGRLRIGSIETTTGLRLPPLLSRYGALYPQVDVSLASGPPRELIDAVLDYRIEGAFVPGPVDHPQLVSAPAFEETLAFYAPASITNVRRYVTKESPKIVVFREGCSFRGKLQAVLGLWSAQPPRVVELGSLDGILGCVAAGLGFTLLPAAIGESGSFKARWAKGISVHRLPGKVGRMPTVFVRRSDAFTSGAMSAFLSLLA
jgi:DNA-binding transcriptional LysR family regulator